MTGDSTNVYKTGNVLHSGNIIFQCNVCLWIYGACCEFCLCQENLTFLANIKIPTTNQSVVAFKKKSELLALLARKKKFYLFFLSPALDTNMYAFTQTETAIIEMEAIK